MSEIYTNRFVPSKAGMSFDKNGAWIIHPGYKKSVSSVGQLCNPVRRKKREIMRNLGITGKRFRKLEKRERRMHRENAK